MKMMTGSNFRQFQPPRPEPENHSDIIAKKNSRNNGKVYHFKIKKTGDFCFAKSAPV